jgi:hypothetical protein
MLYIFALILLSVVVGSGYFSYIQLAEKALNLFWLMLVIASVIPIFYKLAIYLVKNKLSLSVKTLLRYTNVIQLRHKVILLVVTALYLSLSLFNPVYYLGGDDTRLYYLYPHEYYTNFVSNTVSDNSLSNVGNFLPSTSISHFVLLFIGLKEIFGNLNLQSFMYSLNIVLGMYFFYLFAKKSTNNSGDNIVYILCALFYVTSIFNIYTLYNSQLSAIYVVSLFPLILHLFYKAVETGKKHFLVLIAVFLTIFTLVSSASFWLLASLLIMSPFLTIIFLKKVKRVIMYGAITLLLVLVFNIHWIYYLPSTTLAQSQSTNSVTSVDFKNENLEGISTTVEINSVFYPLLASFHRQIQINFKWPYLPVYQDWYFPLLPIQIIWIFIILGGGLFIYKFDEIRKLYIGALFTLLLGVYLFTVNIGQTKLGNIGTELFIWLASSIPGFLIFRNMYDKFAHGVSFAFAVTLAISLIALINNKSIKKYKTFVYIIIGSVILITSKPFIFGEFQRLPIWTTSSLYQGIEDFNDDYKNLVSYIESQAYKGRYLFTPLAAGNVIAIQSKNLSDHYYIGVSPLLILTGKNDYSGTLSFGIKNNELFNSIHDKDYEQIGKIFQSMNVYYIVINHDVPDQFANGYLYPFDLYKRQDNEYLSHILGTKVKDFGTRYSIYTINEKYQNQKVFLSDSLNEFSYSYPDIEYIKTSDNRYEITIKDTNIPEYLVFLDENLPGWEVYTKDNNKFGARQYNTPYFTNIWKIDKDLVSSMQQNSDEDIELTLEYIPSQKYNYLFALSTISLMLGIGYVGYKIYLDYQKKLL